MSRDHTIRKPQRGLKLWPNRGTITFEELQAGSSKQPKGQVCGKRRDSFSPGSCGQIETRGSLCSLPDLGQCWCPLCTCLFAHPRISSSVTQPHIPFLASPGSGNLSFLASAQPGSQDTAWGRGSKKHGDLSLGSFLSSELD